MVNVHAAGGTNMMKAALEGLQEGTPEGKERPICIAVTQLTSTSEEVMQRELWIEKSLEETVLHYAKLAQDSGLDGVVCSTLEVPKIREACGEDFVTVTPGIRMADDNVDDQVRIATPARARELGSTYIVVGRSITKAEQPLEAYKKVTQQWEGTTV
jgi:orotidine-5'-phosphate decarboxylase